MAFPTDPPNPGGNGPAVAPGSLNPEEAERLAASFRPSWELEAAPVAEPTTVAEAEVRAAPSVETSADVRGAVQALNGTHAPAPATVLMQEEPASSVIVDRAIAAEVAYATAAQAPSGTEGTQQPPPAPQPQPLVAAPQAAPVAPTAPVAVQQRTLVMANAPRAVAIAPHRRPAPSLDLSDVSFSKRPKAALWLGAGAVVILMIGAFSWLHSGSDGSKAAPALPAEIPKATATSRIPPPPPPVETAAAAPAPPPPPVVPAAAPPPPAAVAPAAPPERPVERAPERPAAAPAPQPPAPRLAVPPAPRQPTWTPAAKPAPKPKSGQTIVRDVPF